MQLNHFCITFLRILNVYSQDTEFEYFKPMSRIWLTIGVDSHIGYSVCIVTCERENRIFTQIYHTLCS